MKQLYSLAICLAVMALSTASAQVYVNSFPWENDLESLATCGGFCTPSCPNLGDFTQAGTQHWSVDVGGTSSSSTGPSVDHNPGTSSGIYLYSEASYPCYLGYDWILESPYFDFTNTSGGYELEFWYHAYGSSMGTAHLDVQTGSSSWTLDVISSWTGNLDAWVQQVVNLTSYAGNDSVRFRVRYENPTNFYGDFALDDFSMKLLLADDAGISQILSPTNPFCGSDTQAIVELTNFGTNNLTSVNIDHTVGGTAGSTINWTGNLATGQTDTITISTSAITPGTSVEFYTSMPNNTADLAPSNDSTNNTYYSGMAGVYTIPGDYATFTDAVNDLVALGVCDSVIFDVSSGNYNEQIEIPEIVGAGPDATITFRGATGSPANVVLEFDGNTNFSLTGVVYFNDADYIYFEDMTLDNTSTGSAYSRVVLMEGDVTHVSFDNCVLDGSDYNTTSTWNAIVYAYLAYLEDVSFTNCDILHGSYAFYMYGNFGGHSDGLTWENNLIDDFYYMAIYSYYNDNVVISGNDIYTDAPYTSARGVYMYDNDKHISVDHNSIGNAYGANIYYGIYLGNCDGMLSDRINVSNNCVSLGYEGNSTFNYGLYFSNSGIMDVVNNTVTLRNTSGTGYVHYVSGGGLIHEQNNNFVTYGTGYARYVTSTYSMTGSMGNNFFSNGSNLLYLNGIYTSVDDFITETGFDMGSVQVDPAYSDTLACESCNDTLDQGGYPFAGINDDINGEIRSTVAPDIGAIEFIAAGSFDLGDDSTYCADELLLESGPAQSVTWIIDGTSSSNPSVLLEANNNEPQTFNVSVNINTTFCGPASDNLLITLVPAAALDSTDHICSQDMTTLDPGGGSSASYMWSDGSMGATLDVDEAGTYAVTVTEEGCESSTSIAITQSAAVELTDAEVCSATLPYGADATIADGISYAWSGGTNPTDAQNTFNDGNTYSVTVTDAFGCTTTDDFTLTVLEAPVAIISQSQSGLAYFFDATTSIYLTPSSSVMWDFGNGTTSTNVIESVIYPWPNPGNPTTYTVTLTIDNGCDESIETVQVTPTVGINTVENDAFSVYPNPAKEVVNIQLENGFGDQAVIEFIDITGRVAQAETISASSDFIQVEPQLAPGTYLVKITGDSRVLVNRVTIE